jgi:homogentisate 1,2-dioxygenase
MEGALPTNQNSPQHCPFGLYAEQISGSAFTRPRHNNLHSWLYRTLPSVVREEFKPFPKAINNSFAPLQAPNPMRWSPQKNQGVTHDFIDGLFHIAGNQLLNTYIYQAYQSMLTRYFSNYDGEFLFVPYLGKICLKTEFGPLEINPGMIAVIPRGIQFSVELLDSYAAGYLCENRGVPLTLPQLGTIGANGLANPRHFLYPKAAHEERHEEVELICKFQQNLWVAKSSHSPLNVVAWHGNYAPYCYDLSLFNTINTVSFDHPDPSIFTVLTSESNTPGVANLDFVIFPSRWMVAENTFRPPYYHRNVMNELMGLVIGDYDAKQEGFSVGGVSIHNSMTPHGPDATTYHKATHQTLKPQQYKNTLAFMLVTDEALKHRTRQLNYAHCWLDLKS